MKKTTFLMVALLAALPMAMAEDIGDIRVFNLEVEKLFNLGSGLLSAVLFILTVAAYRKTENRRLLYVCAAFALFAIKGFLTSSELFFGDWLWVDPLASFLNFLILLAFFAGVIKK